MGTYQPEDDGFQVLSIHQGTKVMQIDSANYQLLTQAPHHF